MTDPTTTRPRQRPDGLMLVTGLLALVVSVFAFVGDVPAVDLRWVLAGGAALVGLALLVSSVRGRRTG